MATSRHQPKWSGVCSVHEEHCIPTARRLYAEGREPGDPGVGTEYHEEMWRLAAIGAPRMSGDQLRTRVVGVRLTPEEYNTLSTVAELEQVSVPELLRRLWFADLERRQRVWHADVTRV